MSRGQPFLNIRTEGSLLPPDLLARLLEGTNLSGLDPQDYDLGAGEKLNEAISRSWTRLQSLWASFRRTMEALPPTDLGTTLTREKWLLPIFHELGYGRLLNASPFVIEEKSYPISHHWHGPHYLGVAHLVSFRAELDKRSEQRIQGASKASPHGLVQEFLNRSEPHLWAFVSNGLQLRILRDNASLTRQAYVEFNLEGIFQGEAYADFRLLWLLGHRSRLDGTTKDRPETCWLEKWSKQAQSDGRRALDQLRDGVEKALGSLGTGFISHPANQTLRDRLQDGMLRKEDLYRHLLRLAYRLIFLFVAEDRDLLHPPGTSEQARSRYGRFYSGQRLRRMAERSRGGRHADLWVSLRLVFQMLGRDEGCPGLGLPALGGFLFGPDALGDLEDCELSNEHLLTAIRHLGLVRDRSGWRLVDYRNLGSEELGSIYESLLELTPTMELEAGTFALASVSGNERKTTGSYYTPDSLIQCLLDSALDPVLEETISGPDPANGLLNLKICDPACGSGHFLIAAAHRIARRLASLRTGEEAPSPESVRNAVRDTIGHCLFGVDINPMAVELCKVSLWLEALEPGKPLSFLDAHIQCGNTLLGTTPALMAEGIPDEAFTALEGDERQAVTSLKRQNRQERTTASRRGRGHEGHTGLFSSLGQSMAGSIEALHQGFVDLEDTDDVDIQGIQAKESRYRALQASEAWNRAKMQADAWCAAFVWEKTTATVQDISGAAPLTHAAFEQLLASPERLPPAAVDKVQQIASEYQFHHWHLAFPQAFQIADGPHGWQGGFDVVLGNPPWERIKLQEKEWFETRDQSIAEAPNAAQRKRRIDELGNSNPSLLQEWRLALRKADGESGLIRNSGRYPLCGSGDINTYSIFAETMRCILAPDGQAGIIVPSGIATDDTTKAFFKAITSSHNLASLFSFENEEFLFPGVHHSTKFSLLTMSGQLRHFPVADFVCFARQVEDLEDPERRFSLSGEDLALLNPNTGTCAVFRTRKDAELTKAIYQRVPVLIREAQVDQPEVNPWGLSFQAMLHMANDSGLFREEADLLQDGWRKEGNHFLKGSERYLPLYEAKMLRHFDHRFGTYAGQTEAQANQGKLPEFTPEQHADPCLVSQPYYWVPEHEVKLRAADLPRTVLKTLEQGREEDLAIALASWAVGGTLLLRGVSHPITQPLLESVWGELSRAIPSFRTLDPKILDPTRGLDQAKESPFTKADRILLETHSDVLSAGEALLEARTLRWFMGWRRICRNTDSRTLIASVLPRSGVGDSFFLLCSRLPDRALVALLACSLSGFVVDYAARQKLGGTNMSYFQMNQLPILAPKTLLEAAPWATNMTIKEWMLPRVLELVYTAWDLQPFAQECEYDGPPFVWDEERRFMVRSELDAALFYMYGVDMEDASFMLDSFPVIRRKDEASHGRFRTKEVILAFLNQIQASVESGSPYISSIFPAPGTRV